MRLELQSIKKMTRAVLQFLLLIMVHQDVVYCISVNCSSNNSCKCQDNGNRVKDDWKVFCSLPEKINLTVSLDRYETATVRCHDMDTWPLEEIEIFKISEKKSAVEFDHCPLPEWPLSNMIERVGIETMKTLKISKLTSTKITRRNFLRLPKIHDLQLLSSGVIEFSANTLQDLSDLRRISFSHNEISVLSRGIFKGLTKLKKLSLNDNKMQRVDSLLFENLSELEFLSLSNNRLKELEPGTFGNLSNLMYLDIGYNYLTTLPKDIFKPLKKLIELQMSGNEFFSLPQSLLIGNSDLLRVVFVENRGNLSALPDKLFANLPSLGNVNLSGNNFTDLREDIFVGSPLIEVINLSRNKLTTLQEKIFKNLTTISYLHLSDNELNNLPNGIFDGLDRLSRLYLQNNAITSIARNLLSNSIGLILVNFTFNQISQMEAWSLSNCTNLRDVFMRRNKLTSLPENIFWGSCQLECLDVSQNTLTDLPAELFRDSRNLKYLYLNSNQLKSLPEGIFQGLNKLLHVDLQNNTFTTLPEKVLAQATSLQTLLFEFNRMTEINFGHLVCLSSIKLAHFSHNLIARIIPIEGTLPMPNCGGYSDLTDLALDHNIITDFLWSEMLNFEHLSLLNLTCNRISSVNLYGFDDVTERLTIDITSNKITTLDVDKFPSYSPIYLYIGDNPIDCGCKVYELRKQFVDRSRSKFRKTYGVTADHLTCSGPESMNGTSVDDLELETFECELNDSEKPTICLEECECMRRPFDDTLLANCSYVNRTEAPCEFDGFEGIAIELNLTGNSITEMSFFHQDFTEKYKYEKIRKLFLSHNKITNFTFDVVPRNLSVLHLDNNNLTRLHAAVAEHVRDTTSLQNLTLHSNPWSCDRETREAFNILKGKLDRKIGHAFDKSCLDFRHDKNGDENPPSYITYQMF